MKRLVFALAVIVAGFHNQVAHAAAPAECFANSVAVFSAHPNATHASYIVRGKRSGGSGRCWYADAFKVQVQTNAKPAFRLVAAVAETSALRPAITASARQSRATAITAPARQSRTTAVALAPEPRIMAVALVSPPVIVQFPREIPPAIQIAVNVQELSRLLPVDETPADFESRFSVSGYKVRK
jgi:hypothetical protein